jgi:branched-chain amino acid transport system ATP-binding protein
MLKVNNVKVNYGEAEALRDVSLTVNEGEVVTIVGPNGAGKTTLVNALVGILPVRDGSIVLDGQNLCKTPAHRICHYGIAVVPEGRRIFPQMSVRHNLDLGAFLPKVRGFHAETLKWVYELFPILQERENQLAGTLSGGQQQMLAVGRALMAKPRLLLLDEPSLGLAPVLVDSLFEAIRTIHAAGVSVLLVEQNVVKALEVANRGYVLEEGHIVQEAPAAELINDKRVKQAYLGLAVDV